MASECNGRKMKKVSDSVVEQFFQVRPGYLNGAGKAVWRQAYGVD